MKQIPGAACLVEGFCEVGVEAGGQGDDGEGDGNRLERVNEFIAGLPVGAVGEVEVQPPPGGGAGGNGGQDQDEDGNGDGGEAARPTFPPPPLGNGASGLCGRYFCV